jgi:aspartate aminotransferase
MVRLNRGTPVIVACSEATDFKLTPDVLARAITSRTKWLVLNTPTNPTGAVYSAAELHALAEVLNLHPQVWVITDEIYEHFCYDGLRATSLAAAAPFLRERILTVNGVSKSYAMPGFRIGYAGGSKTLIAAVAAMMVQDTSCPSSVGQAAAAAALNGPQDGVKAAVADYRIKRDGLLRSLREVSGLRIALPSGAFYAFASVAGLIGRRTPRGSILRDDGDVALYFLEEAGVGTVAGNGYGMSPYLRLSFAAPAASVEEGARRIRDACARLQ